MGLLSDTEAFYETSKYYANLPRLKCLLVEVYDKIIYWNIKESSIVFRYTKYISIFLLLCLFASKLKKYFSWINTFSHRLKT